jgi:hypothetical protein
MGERLAELHRKVGHARRELEEAARRLAAVREELRDRLEPGARDRAAREAGTPLFAGFATGSGELELHFQALSTEDDPEEPKTEGR